SAREHRHRRHAEAIGPDAERQECEAREREPRPRRVGCEVKGQVVHESEVEAGSLRGTAHPRKGGADDRGNETHTRVAGRCKTTWTDPPGADPSCAPWISPDA